MRLGTIFLETWVPHSRDVPLDELIGQLKGKTGDENGEHNLCGKGQRFTSAKEISVLTHFHLRKLEASAYIVSISQGGPRK